MSDPSHRSVTIERVAEGIYLARNARGLELRFGSKDPDGFTPVELLLAAIAGCSAVDVDLMTSRRAEPELFEVTGSGHKSTEGGNHYEDLTVTFRLRFPEGTGGDAATRPTGPIFP